MVDLRKSTEQLLEEYDSLNAENALLQQEFINTQDSIEKSKKENIKLQGEPPKLRNLIKEKDIQNKRIQDEVKFLEKQKAIIEKVTVSLEKKLIKSEDKENPWKEKADALRLQKADLEVELKGEDSIKEKEVKNAKSNLDQINTRILAKENELKDIRESINSSSGSHAKLLEDIKRLRKENRELSLQLSEVSRDLAKSDKELSGLVDKNVNIDKLTKRQVARASEEKKKWQERVDKLQAKVDKLDQSEKIRISSKKNLLEKVDAQQLKNQELRDKMNDLTGAASLLKRETAMIEDLLDAQKQLRTAGLVKDEPLQPLQGDDGQPQFESIDEAMAYAFAKQGAYEEAVQRYKKALKEGGNKRNIYFNLAYIYYKIGDLRYAIHYYKKVLSVDPGDKEAKYNLMALKEEIRRSKR